MSGAVEWLQTCVDTFTSRFLVGLCTSNMMKFT